ncbi:MAG: hypothetical protein QNK23_12870 [Crocinitomicaceae bacterium]|nr:hypothetical protein [Crocinitomicaceae bacterium]
MRAIHSYDEINTDESSIFILSDPDILNLSAKEVRVRQHELVCQKFEIVLGSKVTIDHTDEGAPILKEFPEINISISHSGEFIAVQWSKSIQIGLDIQKPRDGLYKGRYYFVNETEESIFELNNDQLLIIWSAKEALYKLKKGRVERYKESLVILEIGEEFIDAKVEEEQVRCAYRQEKKFLLVYTL